jgi:hypothetical protein
MLQEFWQKYDQNGMPIIEDSGFGMSMDTSPSRSTRLSSILNRISINMRSSMVSRRQRVFSAPVIRRVSKGSTRSDAVNLMAIDPYDFAQTAWTRSDLYRYHMNEYMNVMMTHPMP